MMNYKINLENVSKYYTMGNAQVKALEKMSIAIDHGEIVVVLGPSGSGKTTLLNLIGALESVTNGTIKIGEKEITKINRPKQFTFRRETIGFIFQTFNLFPTLSALENVQYVADLAKLKKSKQKAIEALQTVGLGDRIRHFPHQLSGGEQQRVAIARALVKNPTIVVADEPTGNLDFVTCQKIADLMYELNKNFGGTYIVVSHDLSITEKAERVFHLRDGEIASVEEHPHLTRTKKVQND